MNSNKNYDEVEFDVDVYFNCEEGYDDNVEIQNVQPTTKCLGIDLGTTNSCVAIWDEDTKSVQVIPDNNNNRTMPSIVSFNNFNYYVGHEAKKQQELNPENTFYEVKRLIGRNIDNKNVVTDSKFLSYKIEKNYEKDENNIFICTNLSNCSRFKKRYTPEELSSIILSKIKDIANSGTNVKEITKAVITVPAYFNNIQRKATQDAATIAGLDCIKIINEPTAAACAYGLEILSRNKNIDLNVIVYDLGGGTLDVSLLNISNGIIEVLGCAGITHLGGSDFDNVLINYCISYFIKKNNIKMSCDEIQLGPLEKQKLKIECEIIKIKLSTNDFATLYIDNFFNDLPLKIKISKTKFEELCSSLLLLCIEPIDNVIKSSNLKTKDINEIILVGGGTRMPMIKRNISAYFGNKPLNDNINPDEVVACGAAIHGHTLCNKQSTISDNILLLDIISLSLGVETLNNLMNVVIPRNTTIPVSKKRKYTTCENNVDTVEIKIFEGERELTKDNFLIGSFKLEGIEKELRGIPEIEVTFNVDANGIVNILAQDVKNKNNKKSITVNSNTSKLSQKEIELMIEESTKMKEHDNDLKNKREFYYTIEDMCNNILVNIEEIKDKMTEEKIEEIKDNVNNVRIQLSQKPFDQHEKSDYIKLHNFIKTKYNTLILKINKDNLNFKESSNSKIKASNVYEDDDINDYFLVEDNNDSDNESNDNEERDKILEIKKNMIELCNDTLSIIMNEDTVLNYNDTSFLREYIDDCMMWLYVSKNIKYDDYEKKISDFNDTCNSIMSKYDNVAVTIQNDNRELALSLLDLLTNISDKNIIPNYNTHIEQLNLIVQNGDKENGDQENGDQENGDQESTQNYLNDLIEIIQNIETY